MSAHHNRIPPDPERDPATPSDPAAADGADGSGESAAQAFANLSAQIAQLKEYAAYYAAAKLDGIKWSMTRIAVMAVLGIVALIVGAGVLVTAAVLFVTGLASGLGRAFGPDMAWLGWIIVGGLVLVATAIGALMGLSALTKSTQRRMAEKYENKRRRQQYEYGTNVRSRAAGEAESVGSA